VTERRIAFVTGASRGIGAAASVALAKQGFDVVATARTLEEGRNPDGRPLPGSLETTARAVRALGRAALPLRLDLLDPSSIDAALEETRKSWGTIDLLLNNGIYTGPGSMEHFLDLDLETVRTIFQANLFAQIALTQKVLPEMLARKSGTIINMVSGAGLSDPPAPAGEGGWGFAYAASKAALHRLVGVLAVEHRNSGVRFYNVEPGFVMTEAMKLNDPEGQISAKFDAAPPQVPAVVIAWLARNADAARWNGQTVFAQKLALKLGLHPDWRC
jgi:hypothetical protein